MHLSSTFGIFFDKIFLEVLKMRFSELLTDLRKEYNLSQMQLAEQIGVSQSTIAKLEIGRNEATASTLAKLAAFFDVSTDYLLGLSDEYEGTGKSAPTAPTALPLDESELLRNYRALSYSGKARVAAYVDLLREQEEGSPSKISNRK